MDRSRPSKAEAEGAASVGRKRSTRPTRPKATGDGRGADTQPPDDDLRRRFEELVQISPDALLITQRGKITFANPRVQQIFGYEPEELVGQAIEVLVPQRVRERHQHHRARYERSPVARPMGTGLELAGLRKDGTEVPIEISLNPLTGDEVMATVRDITDRKEAERRLAESRANLDQSNDAFYVVDADDGRIVDVTAKASEDSGFTRSMLSSLHIWDLDEDLHDVAGWHDMVEEIRRGGRRVFASTMVRADGSSFPVEVSARYVSEGGPARVVAVVRDITERLMSQREQQAAAERLAAIVETVDEAIISKDLDGVVQTWNKGAERLYGFTARQAIGSSVRDLIIPAERHEEFEACLARIRAGEPVPPYDTQRRHAEGHLVDVMVAMTPMRDASGDVVGSSVTAFDVGPRKRAEEAEKARVELNQVKAVDRALRDFINAAAHDLQQPLTPMMFALRHLKLLMPDLTEEQQRPIEMLQRNVDRMSMLVQDLLDVARMEAGTLEYAIEPIPLDDVFSEAKHGFEAQAADRGVQVTAAKSGLRVHADRRRVMQVLFNLVGNAVKFTGDGGQVTISASPTGQMVRVAVKDTGPGLSPDQINKLFKPFSQVHERSEGAPKGTGLGLYISKGIIEQHGGSIGVESDGPGRGATFWFTLPTEAGAPADP